MAPPTTRPADMAIVNCTALLSINADRATFAPSTTIEITDGKFTRIDSNPAEADPPKLGLGLKPERRRSRSMEPAMVPPYQTKHRSL